VDRAALQRYCLARPGAWLDEPWDGDHVVKVADKIFAFLGSAIPDDEIREAVDASYDQVVAGRPRSRRPGRPG
jgi:predicted DNA-binding protein (MmcQ/YjbR family)